jgi:hypothetical protein
MPAHRAPRASASSTAKSAPHAMSRRRSSGPTPNRWCNVTYSRQFAGSLSVAKSTARRPHPSSTILQASGSALSSPVVTDGSLSHVGVWLWSYGRSTRTRNSRWAVLASSNQRLGW